MVDVAQRATAQPDVSAGHHRGLPYAPGLDGLRAIAVTVVLLFHAGVSWTSGGYIGVDLFFVISGFLITSLLLVDYDRLGRVDLRDFYRRRARRLLPALYLLLVVVTAWCVVFARGELASLGGQVLSALLYVSNWYYIAENLSYFQALGRPPLLLHLWSLAVEEQYYIVWGALLTLLLPRVRRRLKPLIIGLAVAALVSTALMAWWYSPVHDASRVYFGTDTHAAPLLVGSMLALLWNPRQLRGSIAPGAVAVLDTVGIVSLVAFVWVATHATVSSGWMYRGGFLMVSIVCAAVIGVVVHPASRLGRLLGTAPILWVGVRSYSLYLWHWPVFVFTRPGLDVPLSGLSLLVLRLGITVTLAALSYRFVETPLRHGAMGRWWQRVRDVNAAGHDQLVRRSLSFGIGGVAVLALLLSQLVWAPPPTNVARDPHGKSHQGKVADSVPDVPATGLDQLGPAHPIPDPLRVTVVGDSQGMTLLLNVSDKITSQFGFTNGTVEGCGVLGGVISSVQGMKRDLDADCAGWATKWHDRVAGSHAQIGLIMLGAWDVFDDTVDGHLLKFGTPSWDANFNQHLQRGIRAVTDAGAVAALAELPCYRPISAGGLPALPERGQDWRTRHVNELLRRAADADPHHVVTVTPPAAFCTNERVATDTAYRWDGVHYYIPGAQLFMATVGPQLLAIAHHVPEATPKT
jgi:peptidoglycan/LPS O-acetylase OafA/YrhL